MNIAARYAWDGASGPTFDTKDTMTPSLIHDAFYQLMREGVLDVKHKQQVDDLFYHLLLVRARKRSRLLYPFRFSRAKLWHWAVTVGGPTSSYVLEAP